MRLEGLPCGLQRRSKLLLFYDLNEINSNSNRRSVSGKRYYNTIDVVVKDLRGKPSSPLFNA